MGFGFTCISLYKVGVFFTGLINGDRVGDLYTCISRGHIDSTYRKHDLRGIDPI